MKLSKKTKFILALIVLTFFWVLVYAIPQQALRRAANHPQIEMAKEAATAVGQLDVPPYLIKNPGKVDIASSSLPYLIVFDENKKVILSTAVLGTQDPVPPLGVLSYAQKHQIDKVTWQPKPGVRQAIVAMPYNGKYSGFVVAGRSLTSTEKKEDLFFKLAFWGWVISIFLLLASMVFKKRKKIAN